MGDCFEEGEEVGELEAKEFVCIFSSNGNP